MARTRAFDTHPERYEEWFEENPWVYRTELEAIRHFIPESGEGLEVGIGSGRFALPLGIRVGVDPSSAMRQLAEAKGLTVHDAGAEALPLPDAGRDFVLMVTTVCFLDDVARAFGEAHRVLKTGGSFIVGLIDRETPLGERYLKKKDQSLFYREACFHSAREVLAYLQRAGFREPQVIQTVFGDLEAIDSVQTWKEGSGEGGFVVIKVEK